VSSSKFLARTTFIIPIFADNFISRAVWHGGFGIGGERLRPTCRLNIPAQAYRAKGHAAAPQGSNMVERFFRDLTHNQLRRGIFRNLEELIMAIEGYIDRHNQNPKPFIWTARAGDILEKVKRARQALNQRQSA